MTEPLPGTAPVVLDDGTVVTFWVHYPQNTPAAKPDPGVRMGRTATELDRFAHAGGLEGCDRGRGSFGAGEGSD
ncbi:hypothetical protein Aglo03_07150 [Actinokineospora globicatena]|uniref:Uncharacterized protein n=1 Tax=Actinokineospora globicatena TaxID=103729 RepID=A0A9W6V7E6_9PSEU|nr:hypothetical protein Aglo03_07150 [Actinokineospora globicatena]